MTAFALVVAALGAAPTAAADNTDTRSWAWPLAPTPAVEQGFDPPSADWSAGHRGVDLLASPGQVVTSVEAGKVQFVGAIAGRGVVVVRHGDLRSTYQPVTALVHVGDTVARGQAIGLLSAVGSHCLPSACLHLGVLRGDEYLDPLAFLGPTRIRLKPVGAWPAVPWI